MTSSTAVKIGCLAALSLTVSLPGFSAPRFTAADQPLGSIAPIVFSNADLVGGTTKGYRPWFENGSWQGDLVEYTVTASGRLSTSVSFTQASPTNTGSNWSALVNFAAREKADAAYWDTGRKIITFNSSANAQVPFRFTDAGIGAANKALLDSTAGDDASDILNYVRGDRSNEYPEGAQLRHRTSILGDIIHSRPVYVGPPNDIRPESGYAKFAKDNAGRARRVYVGANDGMLHVFDAANGNEVYAYVPSMLMGKLRVLTARPYPHAYYVDGEMSVRDVQINDEWRTVLAGSLGAGGRGFFILDITDPNLTSESSTAPADKKVLFEHTTSIISPDNDLGDSFSRPVIAKLNDGDWYVITGNGYNSVSGVATLYLVNLDTLAISKISTSSGSPGNPNGLSSPSLLDTNRDGKADYAYAGDIDGNLWKFDLKGSSANAWKVAYDGDPLHPTAGKQAITQAPQIALHPRYGYMIYFATGRLYNVGDLNDTSIQSLYGIWDSGKTPPTAANQSLLEQTWDGPKTYIYRDGGDNAADQTIAIYNPDGGDANWDTQHGWKVDFPAGGYRVLQPVQVRANRVKATVYKPTVNQQGENWLVEAVLTDGGPNPPAAPIYDLNVDRKLNQDDLYAIEGDADAKVPMMWRQVDGIMSQVTIGAIANGVDTLFINYLQPSVPSAPCTENCPAGFFNGHIDVQTYLSAGANATPRGSRYTGHAHVYDKLMARVYVNFFDITTANPTNANLQNHVEIDSTGAPFLPASGISDSEEFIVLVANADFSPGGTLHIGSREWNVLDYQIRIHKALKNWDPGLSGSYPVDDDGERLVFTWGEIKEAGGTIKLSFNDRAILDGGLHPTQSQCVITNATGGIINNVALPITYDPATKIGRWRNGALTIQLVSKSYFTDNPVNPALAMVDIQKPLDLAPYVITDKGAVLTTSIDDNNDGDTEDDYEQIGGLLAQNDPEHLWESTVFWHFGDLSRFTSLGAPCYYPPFPNKDDPKYKTWAEAVALEQDNDPITATLAKRGDDLTVDTLEAAIDALKAQGCDDAQAACNGEYKIFKSILALSDDYLQAPDDVDDSDADSDAPVVIEGGSTGAGLEGDGGDGAITEGNTFRTGRMSWTDIVN